MTPAELICSSNPKDRERGQDAIRNRHNRMGWTLEEAMHTPIIPKGARSLRQRSESDAGTYRTGDCTLQEVADELGVSRERVRQIEERALAKLRLGLERAGVDAADVVEWLSRARPGDMAGEPGGYDGPGGSWSVTGGRERALDARIAAQEPSEQTMRAEAAIAALEAAAERVEAASALADVEAVCVAMEAA